MRTMLQVTTPPDKEPVTVAIARAHCRIDNASDDELIATLITVARTMVEAYLSRALINQTLTWTVRPEGRLHPNNSRPGWRFELPRAPIRSIGTVTVTDTNGNATTVPAASLPIAPSAALLGYLSDLLITPCTLDIGPETVMADGRAFRAISIQHIAVVFVAGYGEDAASVPPTIVQAILMLVAFLYEHRGDQVAEMPKAVEWLLDPLRLMWV